MRTTSLGGRGAAGLPRQRAMAVRANCNADVDAAEGVAGESAKVIVRMLVLFIMS